MGWGVHDYPAPPSEEPMPVCPICGEECETVYLRDGQPVGCDRCLLELDADEWLRDTWEELRYG